jgi:hypothetical protein
MSDLSGESREICGAHAIEPHAIVVERDQGMCSPTRCRAGRMVCDHDSITHDRREQRKGGIDEIDDIDLATDRQREVTCQGETIDAGRVHGNVDVGVRTRRTTRHRPEYESETHVVPGVQSAANGID